MAILSIRCPLLAHPVSELLMNVARSPSSASEIDLVFHQRNHGKRKQPGSPRATAGS